MGNVVKQNASISGAEVGCQGEIGVACAMAAAAAAQLLGAAPHQIEYAAEMGLEHHLGLTCDPVMGLVQIPCIERNVFAAVSALACAEYALFSDGRHLVSFDQVVEAMNRPATTFPNFTGKPLCDWQSLHSRLVADTLQRRASRNRSEPFQIKTELASKVMTSVMIKTKKSKRLPGWTRQARTCLPPA